jgi:poly-gamma-glutamate synthesis protein (capsule biosynthesis protein)
MGKEVVIYAVGDVFPDRDRPDSIFEHVSAFLRKGDVVFCQLESPLGHTTVPSIGAPRQRDPSLLAYAIKKAGFSVVSFASNHCMEDGVEAFLRTIEYLRREGVRVIGVGKDIKEARKPAIFECNKTRIAFLAYNSVGKSEVWADQNKPGCAPIRVWTLYEPMEPAQPGTPARVHTFPYREDLAAMAADIKNAKSEADVVVVSIHSGIHITPVVIAEYQVDAAHAAIDAGADLVLQHHAHILKGIEVYRGKVIFYGLGNFAIEVHFMTKEWAELPEIKEHRKALNPDWNPPYEDYPSFPFPPDSRKSMIIKCVCSDREIKKVSFLPVMINKRSEPEILKVKDAGFKEVASYVEAITRGAGLNTKFLMSGEEVIIETQETL